MGNVSAPEILDYSPVTPAADIWSLGCVVYVMLTGLSPFAGEDLQETYLNVSQGMGPKLILIAIY